MIRFQRLMFLLIKDGHRLNCRRKGIVPEVFLFALGLMKAILYSLMILGCVQCVGFLGLGFHRWRWKQYAIVL